MWLWLMLLFTLIRLKHHPKEGCHFYFTISCVHPLIAWFPGLEAQSPGDLNLALPLKHPYHVPPPWPRLGGEGLGFRG